MLLASRLASETSSHTHPADVWASFQARGSEGPLQLVASPVDCPTAAGTCDPLIIVDAEFGNLIKDADIMLA